MKLTNILLSVVILMVSIFGYFYLNNLADKEYERRCNVYSEMSKNNPTPLDDSIFKYPQKGIINNLILSW